MPETVSVLMQNNSIVEITIRDNLGGVPKVHPHSWPLSIGGSHEVRIVHAGTILGVQLNSITSHS